jgi:predicted nucleic acid-binding protein
MSGKYLLDTNIIIALFAEDPFVKVFTCYSSLVTIYVHFVYGG